MADESYSKAMKVLHRHRKGILKVRGVRGFAVGKASDFGGKVGVCLVIYADRTADRRAIPDEIEGFPVYVLR